MKEYRFLVKLDEDHGGKEIVLRTYSKHIQGAIRKIYQEHKFDTILKILSC